MKRICLIVLALCASAAGTEISGVTHWRGSELKAYGKRLAPKMSAQKLATEQMAKFANHHIMAAHREADGEAELHETETDIFIVEAGQAVLHVGGEVVGARTTAPGEIRGRSIKGGEKIRLGPGDIVNIPAKTPHQVLLDGGKPFTYLIVKVVER